MDLPSDWQINRQDLSTRGRYLWETGQWSDCEFIVGQESQQQRFKGHKLFLAMCSPVFEAMFFGCMAEKIDPITITITGMQADIFKAMLEYIYTDCVDLGSFDAVCELWYSAEKYMLPSLAEKCTKFLSSNLAPNNALQTYELAKSFEEPILMHKCLEIICTRTHEVLNETMWERIKLGTLVLVLEQDTLEIYSEMELYSALEHWAKAESLKKSLDYDDIKTLRSVIESALFKVRFLTVTSQEFADRLGVCSLLTQDEGFAIFMNLLCTESKIPMPQGFSTNTCRRTKLSITEENNSEAESSEPKRDLLQGLKYICLRHLGNITKCLFENKLYAYITVRVDKDVYLLGVQVPARVDTPIDEVPYMYTYKIRVSMCDSNSKSLLDAHYSKEVLMHTLIDITFSDPVYIERYKSYQIHVTFEQAGHYPIANIGTQNITCGSVSFTIKPGIDKTGVIRSIIFSYPPDINCHDETEQQPA